MENAFLENLKQAITDYENYPDSAEYKNAMWLACIEWLRNDTTMFNTTWATTGENLIEVLQKVRDQGVLPE